MLRHFREFKCGDRSALGMKRATHDITYWEKLWNDHYIHLLPYYLLHWKSAVGFFKCNPGNLFPKLWTLLVSRHGRSYSWNISPQMPESNSILILGQSSCPVEKLSWGWNAPNHGSFAYDWPLLEFSYKERILTLLSHKNMAHKVLLLERLFYPKPTQLLLFCSRNASPRHQIFSTTH